MLLVSSVSHLSLGSLNRLWQHKAAASVWSWDRQNARGSTAAGPVASIRLQ